MELLESAWLDRIEPGRLFSLEGKVAVVTGAAGGVGRWLSAGFGLAGARLLITDRAAVELDSLASELAGLGVEAEPFVRDLGDSDAAAAIVDAAVQRLGGIDILVNNAGFGRFKPLVEMDLETFTSVFRTNVTGAMLMAREAAKRFVAQESGHLLNISSTSGLKGGQRSTAYASSKFALRGMTDCWRDELRRHNVRVTLVNPSEVQTPFFAKIGHEQKLSEKKLRPEEIADAIVGALEIDDRGFIPEFSVFATNPF